MFNSARLTSDVFPVKKHEKKQLEKKVLIRQKTLTIKRSFDMRVFH